MTVRSAAKALIGRRKRKARRTAAQASATAASPQDGLLQAAQNGQFEELVAKALPEQPPAMVTPEEREAELRRTGRWPQDEAKARPEPANRPEPPPDPPPEPERELTPNEQYIAEHCHWRRRGPSDYRETHQVGRCLTEYDPLSGEIIGDGYIHSEDDDEW
jgi:hypothetical protein